MYLQKKLFVLLAALPLAACKGGESTSGDAHDNNAPTPSFTMSTTTGTIQTTIQFDASASSDLDENPNVLEFAWDWNSDGTFDTASEQNLRVTSHQYATPGTYTVTVKVTGPRPAGWTTRLMRLGEDQSSPC